ncbi:MAG: hypothetical protein IKN53_05890, partial [Oscillibacter sp.]|nr:hypothetical protein [Oscillibacter sp.]
DANAYVSYVFVYDTGRSEAKMEEKAKTTEYFFPLYAYDNITNLADDVSYYEVFTLLNNGTIAQNVRVNVDDFKAHNITPGVLYKNVKKDANDIYYGTPAYFKNGVDGEFGINPYKEGSANRVVGTQVIADSRNTIKYSDGVLSIGGLDLMVDDASLLVLRYGALALRLKADYDFKTGMRPSGLSAELDPDWTYVYCYGGWYKENTEIIDMIYVDLRGATKCAVKSITVNDEKLTDGWRGGASLAAARTAAEEDPATEVTLHPGDTLRIKTNVADATDVAATLYYGAAAQAGTLNGDERVYTYDELQTLFGGAANGTVTVEAKGTSTAVDGTRGVITYLGVNVTLEDA